ncbi:hypothetical protein, partial [Oceanobacillus bengalensis]
MIDADAALNVNFGVLHVNFGDLLVNFSEMLVNFGEFTVNFSDTRNKVGKPFSWLPPYQTVRALLRHTAYPYVTMIIKR